MFNLKRIFLALVLVTSLAVGVHSPANAAATKEELNADADSAYRRLLKTNPAAADLAAHSKAVLIFPSIVKAGFVFGGGYGEGVLKEGSAVEGYFNSITASWGLQIGAQSYGYVVFLMNDKALHYVRETHGWEVGVGPTVAVVNEGVAKNLSSTTLQKDAYAFIFNQQGLMASLSLEGTKISRISNP